jgi:hypothetical protein
VPSGDSPDGTCTTFPTNKTGFCVLLHPVIPVGGSPTGAGESPAPPIFRHALCATGRSRFFDCLVRLGVCGVALSRCLPDSAIASLNEAIAVHDAVIAASGWPTAVSDPAYARSHWLYAASIWSYAMQDQPYAHGNRPDRPDKRVSRPGISSTDQANAGPDWARRQREGAIDLRERANGRKCPATRMGREEIVLSRNRANARFTAERGGYAGGAAAARRPCLPAPKQQPT